MKRIIAIQLLLCLGLSAEIKLSQQEEKNWQIKTALAQEVQHVPVGQYLIKVSIPPKLLYTLSVPYEAQVVLLNKASFEKVKKGELLASLTATQWIEAQKDAISDAIELMHHEHIAERKQKLCEEEVIAQKECIAANAEVKTDKIKLSASRTLLKAYGASEKMITTLFKELKIYPQIPVISPINGTILEVNIQPGKSVSPSSSLFVLKKEGAYWLECDLSQETANQLSPSDEVMITAKGRKISSKLLNLSPVLNVHNQTRHARFTLPKEEKIIAGYRWDAKLSIAKKAYFVSKKSVVQDGEKSLVFIKKEQGYEVLEVSIMAENTNGYYLAYDQTLESEIAISGTSVLSNMLDEGE